MLNWVVHCILLIAVLVVDIRPLLGGGYHYGIIIFSLIGMTLAKLVLYVNPPPSPRFPRLSVCKWLWDYILVCLSRQWDGCSLGLIRIG